VAPAPVTTVISSRPRRIDCVWSARAVRDATGEVSASGGKGWIFHAWSLDLERLRPLGYKYRLPDP